MTLLGLDFDNTLVCYDKLFHELAVDRNLIPSSFQIDKLAIRNHLRKKDLDNEFTKLQAEVYGKKIIEAVPAEGLLQTLESLKSANIDMKIISHKTRTPYSGPKYNLHAAALGWLKKFGLFDSSNTNCLISEVYFMPTKLEKIKKIIELKCDAYVDDLPSILEELPNNIKKIHYSNYLGLVNKNFIHLQYWNQFENIKNTVMPG